MEPYDPIPGRVPRKVAIDRKKKEYASFNIEQILADNGNKKIIQELTFYPRAKRLGCLYQTLMTQLLMTFHVQSGSKRRLMKMATIES